MLQLVSTDEGLVQNLDISRGKRRSLFTWAVDQEPRRWEAPHSKTALASSIRIRIVLH